MIQLLYLNPRKDMVNILVDTGSKYDVKINIDKSQIIKVSRRHEAFGLKYVTDN